MIGLLPVHAGGVADTLMVGAPFEIQTRLTAGVHRLTVVGEIDLATAPALDQCLREVRRGEGSEALEVDLRGVCFMDAGGLRILLEAYRRGRAGDGPRLRLVGASGPVRRLLELTGASELLDPAAG